MAIRRIPQDEMLFVVTNTYSKAVVVANRRVNPGESKEIPARYVVGNISRCQAMSTLVTQSKIAVQIKFTSGGLNSVLVSAPYLLSLQAATGNAYGVTTVLPTASLPAAGKVPEGFQAYDSTLDKPQYWDGAAWVDGAGL